MAAVLLAALLAGVAEVVIGQEQGTARTGAWLAGVAAAEGRIV